MSTEHDLLHYPLSGSQDYAAELQRGIQDCGRRITALEQIIDGLLELAPACTSKTRLLRKYEALKRPKGGHNS